MFKLNLQLISIKINSLELQFILFYLQSILENFNILDLNIYNLNIPNFIDILDHFI